MLHVEQLLQPQIVYVSFKILPEVGIEKFRYIIFVITDGVCNDRQRDIFRVVHIDILKHGNQRIVEVAFFDFGERVMRNQFAEKNIHAAFLYKFIFPVIRNFGRTVGVLILRKFRKDRQNHFFVELAVGEQIIEVFRSEKVLKLGNQEVGNYRRDESRVGIRDNRVRRKTVHDEYLVRLKNEIDIAV